MAACGIQEHNEARKQQEHCDRRSFLSRQLAGLETQKQIEECCKDRSINWPNPESRNQPNSSYDMTWWEQQAKQNEFMNRTTHFSNCINKPGLRRYSAKLPNRFSNYDYFSQW